MSSIAIAQEDLSQENTQSIVNTSLESPISNDSTTINESTKSSATEKDWSVGDFEKAGFILGSIISEAKCPNALESTNDSACGGNSRTKMCRVGKTSLCFDESHGVFTDFEYILPNKCHDKKNEALLAPHKLSPNDKILVFGDRARFWRTNSNCNSNKQDESSMTVNFRLGEFGDGLDSIISTMSFPPTIKLFELGKTTWFQGTVSGFSNTNIDENFCAKKWPNSVARIFEKGTGVVGISGFVPHVTRQSSSKIMETKFVCYQKINAEFEEGRFSSLAYKAIEENGNLPPSKQKPEGYYDKEFLNKLISEGRKQIKCPEGFSKSSESYNLSNDYYEIECQTSPTPLANLCPKSSIPQVEHVGGDVEKNKSGGTITTLIYEASETCFKSECYPGTFAYQQNYCAACPKGTTFDSKETEQYYKRDKLRSLLRPEVILCKGSASLKQKKLDTEGETSNE